MIDILDGPIDLVVADRLHFIAIRKDGWIGQLSYNELANRFARRGVYGPALILEREVEL